MADVYAQIDAIVLGVMNQVANDMEDDIKDSISTLFPPASTEGTPPHLRSGNLRALITSAVTQGGNTTTVDVVSEADYSVFLEGKLNRRFMGPALERWEQIVPERLNDALNP